VALAGPRVLLLDEPFAGLDQGGAKWLQAHLTGFKAAGGAVLMTTHSFGRSLGIVDRIAILAQGRIALDTPVGTLGADDVRRLYEAHAEDGA
jgi:ABC-type multidrug transport system ATPase subunit